MKKFRITYEVGKGYAPATEVVEAFDMESALHWFKADSFFDNPNIIDQVISCELVVD